MYRVELTDVVTVIAQVNKIGRESPTQLAIMPYTSMMNKPLDPNDFRMQSSMNGHMNLSSAVVVLKNSRATHARVVVADAIRFDAIDVADEVAVIELIVIRAVVVPAPGRRF
uniref:Uncharacterized protein n=1 Tax=Romanomermis culicivorax TaxID=13658 RepID=A0A915KYL1_ROMCU